FAHHLHDLVDRLGGGHVVTRWQHPQGLHVLAEQVGLPVPQLLPVHTVPFGTFEERVVDVGRVLHVVDLVAGVQQEPVDEVEGEVGGGVTQVGGVVRGDPADVHPGDAVRRDLRGPTARGVVQTEGGGLSGDGGDDGDPGPGRGNSPSSMIDATRAANASISSWARSAVRRRWSAPLPLRSESTESSPARSSSGSGVPAHPHRTVRSLGSVWNARPWSIAHTSPSESTSRCPPLRSALLMTRSNRAARRILGVTAWATTTSSPPAPSPRRTATRSSGTSLRGWTSTGSGPTRTPVDGSSIQRCAIPGPPGPEA